MPGERPPRVLGGRYRLLRPIATGGMAEVWEGHDEVLARPVAVKVLLESLASDPSVRERFRREAVTAARLAHPNVVATFDTGIDEGTAYIVMELVRGRTLRDLLADRGPLPLPVALSVADQVADALAHAHRAGLVHRDIKPGNVLVAEEDGDAVRVKVTDFGIAKAAEGATDLTLTGMVLGTPKYLSPEQVEGREPDARADLYALGVVLFEMLAGRAPFQGPTQMATALSHLRDEAPAPSSLRPAVPAAVDALVAALLAKDPDGRHPTAIDVRRALAEAARATPPGPLAGRRRAATDPTTVSPPVRPGSGSAGAGPPGPAPLGDAGSARWAGTSGPGRPRPPWPRRDTGWPVAPADGAAIAGPVGAPAAGAGGWSGWGPVPAPGAGTPGPTGVVPLPSGGVPGATAAMPPVRAAAGSTPTAGTPLRRPVGPDPADGGWSTPRQGGAAPAGGPQRAGSGTGGAPAAAGGATARGGAPRRPARRRRASGLVVGGLATAAVVVAAVLLSGTVSTGDGGGGPANPPATPSQPYATAGASVWIAPGHTPDDAAGVGAVVDGDPATAWHTDIYRSARFGNLYPGIGVAVHLAAPHVLHQLTVTSPGGGWTAQAYVASSLPPPADGTSGWGTPTGSAAGAGRRTTIALGGRSGAWVLLWLTSTGGPPYQATIDEIQVS